MATFIETPELTGTKTPTSATGILTDGWGIDTSISGYIIQNIQTTHSRITDQTQDQKGAVIGELDYDEQWGVTFDLIGNPSSVSDAEQGILPGITVGDTAFSFAGKTWKVESCNFAGTFNDKKKWQVSLMRYTNFPS